MNVAPDWPMIVAIMAWVLLLVATKLLVDSAKNRKAKAAPTLAKPSDGMTKYSNVRFTDWVMDHKVTIEFDDGYSVTVPSVPNWPIEWYDRLQFGDYEGVVRDMLGGEFEYTAFIAHGGTTFALLTIVQEASTPK